MDMSAGPVLRWCRALLLAGVALTAGIVAHLGADGLMPGPRAVVVLFLLCAAGAACFLGRPASRPRVVALLVGGQTFVHGGLTALVGHRGDPPLTHAPIRAPVYDFRTTTGAGHRIGSLMDQFAAAHPAGGSAPPVQLTVPYPVQHLLADLTAAHGVMALWHLAAAVVVGLWLAAGERALWTVLTLTGEVAVRLLGPALPRWRAAAGVAQVLATTVAALGHRTMPSAPARLPARDLTVLGPLVRRGPPALRSA